MNEVYPDSSFSHRDKYLLEQSHYLQKEEDQNDTEDTWRHTYQDEQDLMQAIREGRAEDVTILTQKLDADTGRLSRHEYEHWKTTAIIGITLCSRAAIEGGLSPAIAYRLSGYYIQKCHQLQGRSELLAVRDHAIRDFASRVYEKSLQKTVSAYTEACIQYIEAHYREKLYLDSIAESLRLSPAYLSRRFHEDTGIRFQDYVNQVRVKRAMNLLKYSNQSLSEIAAYVHFPSQSYFGKVFKDLLHMTPREYREQFKTIEWQESVTSHKI